MNKEIIKNGSNKIAEIYGLESIEPNIIKNKLEEMKQLARGSTAFDFQYREISKEIGDNFEDKSILKMISEFDKKIDLKIGTIIKEIKSNQILDNKKLNELEIELKNKLHIDGICFLESDLLMSKYFKITLGGLAAPYFDNPNLFLQIFDFLEMHGANIMNQIEKIEDNITKLSADLSYINRYLPYHEKKIEYISPIDLGRVSFKEMEENNDPRIDIILKTYKKNEILSNYSQKVYEYINTQDFAEKLFFESGISGDQIKIVLDILNNYIINEYGWIDCMYMFGNTFDLRRIYIEKCISDAFENKKISKRLKANLRAGLLEIGKFSSEIVKKIENNDNESNLMITSTLEEKNKKQKIEKTIDDMMNDLYASLGLGLLPEN